MIDGSCTNWRENEIGLGLNCVKTIGWWIGWPDLYVIFGQLQTQLFIIQAIILTLRKLNIGLLHRLAASVSQIQTQ